MKMKNQISLDDFVDNVTRIDMRLDKINRQEDESKKSLMLEKLYRDFPYLKDPENWEVV
jgi:hypothetical protein